MELEANARRFGGFADLYDAVRPSPPAELAALLCAYAAVERPGVVVDLGSGTGLSTRWAATWATHVIGIEPSDDMRAQATSAGVASAGNVGYAPGWSHATGLPDGTADIVIAVQALHWMEPDATFAEVARILRPGGVFAAIDCDWPPSVGSADAERAWHRARSKIARYEARLGDGLTGAALRSPLAPDEAPEHRHDRGGARPRPDRLGEGVRYWSKDTHLERMVASGRFSHCVEVGALSVERGDAARLVALLRSQGDYQTLVRHGLDDEVSGVTAMSADVIDALGNEPRSFWFTYRARIGVI